MAKDKDVKVKKEKKEKRAETDGVKKSKKDKKKDKKADHVTEALIASLSDTSAGAEVTKTVVVAKADDSDDEVSRTVGDDMLVPFAIPLADDKVTKKVFKTIKKAAKNKTLKRGVKEVVKAVRKTSTNLPSSSAVTDPSAVVVVAADISPMDVISHIPVLCEEHNIPYIFVRSRAELGAAGNTKRPTSVVMICKDAAAKKTDAKAEDEAEFKEAYDGVVKAMLKAQQGVKR